MFGDTKPTSDTPDLKVLHAKIGQLSLKHDYWEGAFTTAGLLTAKRWSTEPMPCQSFGNVSSSGCLTRRPTTSQRQGQQIVEEAFCAG
jgi:hypothetical protein